MTGTAVPPTPRPRSEEILALYALGVPIPALAAQYGIQPQSVKDLASYHKVRRPPASDIAKLRRAARAERIRRNIEDYPGQPLVAGVEVAA